MDPSPDIIQAAVFDFVQDYLDDVGEGRERSLMRYLARYPEAEAAVAREFLRMEEERADDGDSADAADDGELIHRYQILETLGRGGQGSVFLALDPRLGRRVAVKLLDGRFLTTTQRRRFQREAEVIARIDHPAIAEVLDADFEGSEPYIAMRHVPGVDLGEAIRAERGKTVLPLPPQSAAEAQEVARYFERVARALHAAHEVGVVHRDVKPSNLMLQPNREPVILDFGLASELEGDALTRAGEGLGTPEYMAPEQIVDGPEGLDRRVDVYGLGVSLFECLAGSRPFRADSQHELQRAILDGMAPDLARLNGSLPPDLVTVVRTAMDRDPVRRYATAHAFAEDLRRVCEYEPIHARPAGRLLRLRRWAQRQPALASALAVLFLTLTVGLAVAVQGIRVRDGLIETRDGLILTRDQLIAEKDSALDYANSQLAGRRALEILGSHQSASLALAVRARQLHGDVKTRSALFAPLEVARLERHFDVGERVIRVHGAALDDREEHLAAIVDGRHLWIWGMDGDDPGGRHVELLGVEHGRAIAWVEAPRLLVLGLRGGGMAGVQGGEVIWSHAPSPGDAATERSRALEVVDGRVSYGSNRWVDAATGELAAPPAVVVEAAHIPVARVEVQATAPFGIRVLGADGAEAGFIETESAGVGALSPDGTHVAFAAAPGRVQAWNLETGAMVLDQSANFRPESLRWLADGARLLLVTKASGALLWRVPALPGLVRLGQGAAPVRWVSLHGGGERATVVYGDGVVESYGTARDARVPGRLLGTTPLGSPVVEVMPWGADGAFVARTTDGALIRSEGGGARTAAFASVEVAAGIRAMAVDGATGTVVVLDGAAEVLCWAPGSESSLSRIAGGAAVTSLDVDAARGFVALGTSDGDLRIHPLPDAPNVQPRVIRQAFPGGAYLSVEDVAIDPVTGRIAVGHQPRSIRVWDIESPDVPFWAAQVQILGELAWSRSGGRLVSMFTSASRTLRVMVPGTDERFAPRAPLKESLTSLAVDGPFGELLVGCANGEVHVFGEEPEARVYFGLHSEPVTALAASDVEEDPRVISGDAAGVVYLWSSTPTREAERHVVPSMGAREWRSIEGQ